MKAMPAFAARLSRAILARHVQLLLLNQRAGIASQREPLQREQGGRDRTGNLPLFPGIFLRRD